jgi:hypothetical protein
VWLAEARRIVNSISDLSAEGESLKTEEPGEEKNGWQGATTAGFASRE